MVFGVVDQLLHGVPADFAFDDVAVHVVGKAQVFIDGNAVAGSGGLACAACTDGGRAALLLPLVGVDDVAGRVKRKLFDLRRCQDAAQWVVAVLGRLAGRPAYIACRSASSPKTSPEIPSR